MKKILLLPVAAGALAGATGCDYHVSSFSGGWSDADLKAATNLTQTAGIPAGLQGLDVSNCFGTIRITGAGNATAAWTWKLAVRARSEAVAQQIAAGASCQTKLDGGHLTLMVWLPESKEPHSIQSDLEITVPKSASVQAQNRFGRTEIADLTGEVGATNENGRLDIRNIGGSVAARTSFATLSVSNTGPAALQDQNGKIQATGIGGPLEARTSFASLLAQDIRGAASLANQNGKIQATGIRDLLRAETSFDSLVARDVGGAATLRNQNGRIEAAGISGPLDAKTSFASLAAQDIAGPVRLRNQNGGIKVQQAKGDADIETSFDSLRVEGIQGDAILKNQNGGVVAGGISGSVQASTSFAALEMTGAGSKFVCHNQNGAIRLRATSAALTNIEATTSFGTLEVHLAAGLKPAVQARTTFADVESDFPVLMKPRGEDPFAGIAPDTARVSLQNQNGRIRVVRD
jgi:hypothetical protein